MTKEYNWKQKWLLMNPPRPQYLVYGQQSRGLGFIAIAVIIYIIAWMSTH